MTTNQTIDGVPRKALADFIEYSVPGPYEQREKWEADKAELRALLDAPAVDSPIPQHFVEACDKFDWTPEEALRFYADGKHFDTDRGRTRILCTGAIASHALKSMGESYAEMKGIEPAAQPQGEPVAWATNRGGVLELFNSEREALDDLKEWRTNAPPHDVSTGPIRLYAEQPAPGLWVASQSLYAEQPAPLAVVLPERKRVHPSSPLHAEAEQWNACLDELKRLNTARPAHANPPHGSVPCGTHHDNDGLDEWRKPTCCGSCPGGCVIGTKP